MSLKVRITTIIKLLIIQTLIFLFVASCQDSTKRIIADDESSTLFHLTGVVLDYQTNKPVGETTVKVIADSTYEAVTDSTGHYLLILRAEPGVYEVSFEGYGYATMLCDISFSNNTSSNNLDKQTLFFNQVSVTRNVVLYPLTKQMTGTVLNYPYDYLDFPDDFPDDCPPLDKDVKVYITYTGISQLDQAELVLDPSIYWVLTTQEGNFSFYDIPHTDSAFIGTFPFCGDDSCYYGSQSIINLDNSDPLNIQLVAAPMFDAMYKYTGYDSLQRQIVSGWIGLNDPDSTGQVEGAWSITKYNSEQWPFDLGPQDGNGSLLGQVNSNELTIDLNPGWADNNVTLVADTGYYRLAGTWHYSTFEGEVNSGTFEANRVELGP